MAKKKHTLQTVLIYLPPAVLSLLYGLWLFMTPPAYMESALYAGLILLLFIIGYVRFVPLGRQYYKRRRKEEQPLLCRTHRSDARELLRLLVVLVGARFILFTLIYGISLYFRGYGDSFAIVQRIWANHVDAPRYLSLVRNGLDILYDGCYVNLLCPPFYSWLVTLFSPLASNANRAAFIIANLNTVLSGLVLYQLVLKEGNRATALRTLRYFCILPPTFLLSCTVPFSTFLLCSLLCLYCMRQKQLVLSSLLGALAALSHYLGFLLTVPLVLEFIARSPLERWRQDNGKGRALLLTEGASLLLLPMALGLVLLLNKSISADSLAFLHYRQALLGQSPSSLFSGAASLMDRALDSYLLYDTPGLLSQWLPGLICLPVAFLLLFFGQKRLPFSLSAYSLMYIGGVLSFSNRPNVMVLLFCCPGLLVSLGEFSKKPWRDWLMSLLSLLLLLLGLLAYSLGWPIQ